MTSGVWISWDWHRRSDELAKKFGVEYFVIGRNCNKKGISRYFSRCLDTYTFLKQHKSTVFYVQNPSVILAAFVCFFKATFDLTVVVDRHTNFRLGKKDGLNPKFLVLRWISNYSIKHADLTIVTNDHLAKYVDSLGGRGAVLPDVIPEFDVAPVYSAPGSGKVVVFICTYASDEPYIEVLEAARLLPETVTVYVTGRVKSSNLQGCEIPSNIVLTDFLPEDSYVELLAKADIILDFTSLDWCLVCGGYEALALSKPFVTSNKTALKDFYGDGALYAEHSAKSISGSILTALESREAMTVRSEALAKIKRAEWETLYRAIVNRVGDA